MDFLPSIRRENWANVRINSFWSRQSDFVWNSHCIYTHSFGQLFYFWSWKWFIYWFIIHVGRSNRKFPLRKLNTDKVDDILSNFRIQATNGIFSYVRFITSYLNLKILGSVVFFVCVQFSVCCINFATVFF